MKKIVVKTIFNIRPSHARPNNGSREKCHAIGIIHNIVPKQLFVDLLPVNNIYI